ncbi:MAG: hypothetical protein ABWY81_11055 [Jiangellaceae bacterium]
MGFRLNRVYALRFEGALAGLEVDIRSTSIAVVEELADATGARDVAVLLAAHMDSWNYIAEDGLPVPIEVDAICREVEQSVLAFIGREWYKAATGVTAPLDDGSTSGEPSPEESIPNIPTTAL